MDSVTIIPKASGDKFESIKKGTDITKILALSLSAVTVSVVLLAVLGSVYVFNLQNQQDIIPIYQVRHDDVDKYVAEDRKDQIELIKNKDVNGHLVSMISIDYRARLISIYMPKHKACFLIGGIMEEIGSFEDDVPITVVTNKQQSTDNYTAEILYVITDHNPIEKTSLLAGDVLPFCSNTNSFWLERKETKDTRKPRQRRGISFKLPRVGVSFKIKDTSFDFGYESPSIEIDW